MPRPDLNKLAVRVARKEGGADPQNVAEIKEVLGHGFAELSRSSNEEVLAVMDYYRDQRRRKRAKRLARK